MILWQVGQTLLQILDVFFDIQFGMLSLAIETREQFLDYVFDFGLKILARIIILT